MAGKKISTAFVMTEVPKANKLAAAEGKLELMRRIRDLSGDGEKMVKYLMNVLDGNGNVTQGLEAVKILFAYGYGKPIEVKVTADASDAPKGGGLEQLSSAQLEAAIKGFSTAGESEGEIVSDDDQTDPKPNV